MHTYIFPIKTQFENQRSRRLVCSSLFLKHSRVNPALDCCAETACIYICRGSRCFEHTVDKTEQLIILKYSCSATDDPCKTCCHGACAGVSQTPLRRRRTKKHKFQYFLLVTTLEPILSLGPIFE